MCCAMQNRMAEAEAAFRQIVRLRPEDGGAYGNLGNALGAQNKLDDSIPFYLTALKLNPNDYQTEFNLALTCSRLGRRAEAEAHRHRGPRDLAHRPPVEQRARRATRSRRYGTVSGASSGSCAWRSATDGL